MNQAYSAPGNCPTTHPGESAHRVSWRSQHNPIGRTVAMRWTPLGETGPPRRGVGTLPRRPLHGPRPCRGGEVVGRPRDRFRRGRGVRPAPTPIRNWPLLALVGKALKDEGKPMPELTAHTEATVAAVYAHILSMIVMEIESPPESEQVDEWDDPEDIDDAFCLEASGAGPLTLEDDGGTEGERHGDQRGRRSSPGRPGRRRTSSGRPPGFPSVDVEEWGVPRPGMSGQPHPSGPTATMRPDRGSWTPDPAVSRSCMNELGIAEDYYTAICAGPDE